MQTVLYHLGTSLSFANACMMSIQKSGFSYKKALNRSGFMRMHRDFAVSLNDGMR